MGSTDHPGQPMASPTLPFDVVFGDWLSIVVWQGSTVLTPFFVMCQSIWQAANGEWADAGSERKMKTFGLWARMGVTADGAKEGAGKLPFRFCVIRLGMFVSCFASIISP